MLFLHNNTHETNFRYFRVMTRVQNLPSVMLKLPEIRRGHPDTYSTVAIHFEKAEHNSNWETRSISIPYFSRYNRHSRPRAFTLEVVYWYYSMIKVHTSFFKCSKVIHAQYSSRDVNNRDINLKSSLIRYTCDTTFRNCFVRYLLPTTV